MAKSSAKKTSKKKPAKKKPQKKAIESYSHKDKKRANNPPVGLVTPDTDPDHGKKTTYEYDPHLDPQLVWAGKAEHTSFEVPTVSLHVHERIDPRTIIAAVRKRNGDVAHASVPQASSLQHGATEDGKSRQDACGTSQQVFLFEQPEQNPPLREAIEFYKHAKGWTNRLIAGDSLLVMNSLLEKEGMAGKVQMVYLDPPYGIKYGSNFQPFVNKRDVKDGKDDDLTQEPEMIRAFRDTWELEIHSYLTYLRDRLLLSRELLRDSGSCFVQISDENLHHVRELMDEVFTPLNFVGLVSFFKSGSQTSTLLPPMCDYLLWYCRDKERVKSRPAWYPKTEGRSAEQVYRHITLPNGESRNMTKEERLQPGLVPAGSRIFRLAGMTSQSGSDTTTYEYELDGRSFRVPRGGWRTTREGMDKLRAADRIVPSGTTIALRKYLDDFPMSPHGNLWLDTGTGSFTDPKTYVVQTGVKVIQRCMLMCTDPGDLVFDPTCGSGTTAFVADKWGRRWITCDTSRVATALAKQRLMTPVFDYYDLAHTNEGVGSGFKYKTVPHITLKSIANNPEIKEGMSRKAIDAAIAKYADRVTLYDQPTVDKSKTRVSGPFTVEAVPAPAVRSISDASRGSAVEASRDACGTVPQASSLPEGREQTEVAEDADRMSAVRRPKLLSGTHERGYLPHWKGEGATYFVTFRLAGTLPKRVLDGFEAERAETARQADQAGRPVTRAEERRLREVYSEKIEAYLDAGRGDCWLRQDEIAALVADALQHFSGQRYELHAWTIMPNHVHVVMTPLESHSLSAILHRWKSYTGTKCNQLLKRGGQPFWQRESYDHLVRDEREFHRVCEYTINNPVVAGLCEEPEQWPYGSACVPQASSLHKTKGRQDACGTWAADASVGRSGETLRQDEWRDELLKCGIRGKKKQHIHFSRVETLSGTRWLHADAEELVDSGRGIVDSKDKAPSAELSTIHHAQSTNRIVVSFGPEHAPLEQRQVEQALEEAQLHKPTPKMVVFASFQFDPEAAKDIDETNWPGITLLKVQMNTDLLTDDLKKKRSSNESFWMIGQPDVVVNSEQWLVNSRREALAPYVVVAELSGTHSLAEINGLDRDDLSVLLAIAQRRDLWSEVSTDAGGGVGSGQHRGGAGETRHGGVSSFSGHRSRLPGRIGDAGDFMREIGVLSVRDRTKRIKRLRGSREIADRAGEIAASLVVNSGQGIVNRKRKTPLPDHSPLSTIHYSQTTILGFDYYNPIDGKIESGDTSRIAMWMLDTDYDGRSLYPSQVFFPMAGAKDGWARLAKNLKAEIDEELIEAYRGTISLPFEPGNHKRVAVKIIDDRGIESLKIVGVG